MLRELFEEQRTLLDRFFQSLDFDAALQVFDKLLSCKGVIHLSGVGKSGHIAQKIATTLSSTGTRAIFLSSAHALHGDIGLVSKEDIFWFLSKSGESQELIDLLPHIQQRGVFTIGCTSHPKSRLAKACDLAMPLVIQKELCPYDLVPTTSTAAQLIFGDCMAIALMRAKGFSRSAFAANHPAGFLGRKSTLKISDLMLKEKELPLCQPEQMLIELLHELSSKRCGCLLVIDKDQKLLGIFTDGDLRRAIEKKGAEALHQKMSDLMNPRPKTSTEERLAFEAVRLMEEDPKHPITVLPILREQKIVGLLKMHDILQTGL
ncbi:MAG: KpsF/GutQ family sugar-phosphate isomerase [Chlamydiia bacterium]|nr:KpsF/GutQ family sugar-phosphate isomerase [Chlamydiia bacterium]